MVSYLSVNAAIFSRFGGPDPSRTFCFWGRDPSLPCCFGGRDPCLPCIIVSVWLYLMLILSRSIASSSYYLYISDHRVRTTLGNIDSTVAILAQGNHRFETSAQPLFFFYGSNPVMISFLSSVANASRRGEMLPKFGFLFVIFGEISPKII